MLNTLPSAVLLGGFLLAGAAAPATDVVQDCCAPSAQPVAANLSTPALEPVAGPAAVGRVLFVGEAAGRAVHEGEAPEVKPLSIDAKAAEGCVAGGGTVDATDRSLVLSKDGGIANVVIEIAVEGQQAKVPEKPIHMDQTKCRFEPHVVVIPAGSTVEFLNSDSVSHNVHTYAKRNDSMNKTIAAGGKETQKYDKTDQIEVKCDIHPWMNSHLIVTDAAFYDVTDAEGKFSVAGLPAGTHKVDYWHEKLGKG
ncbi:MAG TPA: plastocyanin/azurin family copper-binding protein, partial [Planctomycetota bacterium]|nr:plastocyanin/azurin family copper-binding protein [Planctomycetota bacterium]